MAIARDVHYLDHAATTPMRAAAIAAYAEAAGAVGNPSSLHGSGRRARRVVEESRESLAELLGCRPSEVIFTSGGTESDNLAILGQLRARVTGNSGSDLDAAEPGAAQVLAVSATEHHSVLDSAAYAEKSGLARVEVLPVDSCGAISLSALDALASREGPQLSLVAAMLANNEIGTINNLGSVVSAVTPLGAAVHTDAVQAVGHIPVSFSQLGVTSLSLSAHKFGGPMGIGALLLDRQARCEPQSFGGGQERDLRSGTVDVAAVAAMAAALSEATSEIAAEAERLSRLRDRLVAGVLTAVPSATVNGPELGGRDCETERLPGIANITFPGCSGESLILLLDAAGVECSTGAACTAGVAEPSHVVLALGASAADARSCLRFSLGHSTTEADVEALVATIGSVAERALHAGVGLPKEVGAV